MAEPSDAAILDPTGSFRQRLADDLATLSPLLARVLTEADPDALLRQVETLAHRLAGAAGTFGYPEVSEAMIALEDAIIDSRGWAAAGRGRAVAQAGAAALAALRGII